MLYKRLIEDLILHSYNCKKGLENNVDSFELNIYLKETDIYVK